MGFLKFILILDLIGLVLAGLYALSMMGKRRPKNGFGRLGDYDYAHRGLHALPAGIPENSLRAFRLAANNGYGAELDVHLSRDGRLVIMHDENLKRTTGVNANISAVTTQVLSQLALEGTREKVPYLEEVLPLFNGKAPLLMEASPPPADGLDAPGLPASAAAGGAALPSLPDEASLLLPPS